MLEVIADFIGMVLQGDRHGDVRTYVGETMLVLVAVSGRARGAIRSEGNRLWVWSESVNREYSLVKAATCLLRINTDICGSETRLTAMRSS
jgi:hypothetical protein